MPLHVILNEPRPGAWCRCCRTAVRGTEETVARHMARCAQRHYEDSKPQRDKLAFMKPWDPEYAEWAPRAFKQGKLKPSTDRL